MSECKCTIPEVGRIESNNCEQHKDRPYPCDICDCPDYRPNKVVDLSVISFWPRCLCSHVAEEHN